MEARLRPVGPAPLAREMSGYAGAVLLGLLWLCALLLLARRFSGALDHSPAPATLLAAALSAVGAATAWRLGGLSPGDRGNQRGIEYWLPAVPLLLLGIALSLPGASPVGLSLFWAALLLGEAAAWRFLHPRPNRREGTLQPAESSAPVAPRAEAPAGGAASSGDTIDQQMTRRRGDDGGEVIEGHVRLELATGQRSGSAHVAFCPPLVEAPQFVAEQVGGPPARLKVAQVLPYGARVEFKLQSPSDGASPLLLTFAATSIRRVPAARG